MKDREAHIPFNRPSLVGTEQRYIAEAISRSHISAGGQFTASCCEWLQSHVGCERAFLVHSATAALELAALLVEIGSGDEVVMPSFNFVSGANAVVLRGGTPVFVDIRSDTLNLDEALVEGAITGRTKAILPVHYAGVPCELDSMRAVADRHGISVIEDAAQALGSVYKGKPAGSIGDLAAVSFHETKNVTSGEGGALLVNDARFAVRTEILRDKGTDRSRFHRGEVDKYSWVDLGSSYALSDLNAAFLWAQLEAAEGLNRDRLRTWSLYHEALRPLEEEGLLRRPVVPAHVQHNAHIYYVLIAHAEERPQVLRELNEAGVNAVFHYVPLHTSAGGHRYGRTSGTLTQTEDAAGRLIRLPLWSGISEDQCLRVVHELTTSLRARSSGAALVPDSVAATRRSP
jgi:dTDP-4-amino-4,6-dideoxygalactose transaminase